MRYFQTLFSEKHSNIIEYEGIIYRRFWPVQVNGTIRLKIRILHSSSKFVQAIVFSFPRNFEGIVSVMGNCVPVKKSAFPILNFWEDTAPNEFDVTITNFYGEIKICNGSDPIGTKQFCKHLSEGCAMVAQNVSEQCYRFYCHDHDYGGACDNLVFELEIRST